MSLESALMKGWISVEERLPDSYPAFGMNINHKFKGIILGHDLNNKMSDFCFHCEGLPKDMSMSITHWTPLPDLPKKL